MEKKIKLKTKNYKIVSNPLFLGKISEGISVDNMKKTGLYGYVYYFAVDYKVVAAEKTLGIHKYLTKKNNII